MVTRRRPKSVPDIPGPTPKPTPKPPKPPVKPTPRDTYTGTGEGGIYTRTTTSARQNSGAGGPYGRPLFVTTNTQSITRATGKPAGKPTSSTTKYGYKAGSGRAPYSKGTPVKRRSTPKTAVRGVSSRGTGKTAI